MGSPPRKAPRVISLHIDLAPVAKSSPRALVFGGRGRIYTSAKTKNYMAAVQRQVADALPEDWRPLSRALSVSVTFFIAPARTVKRAFPTPRPDIDNYIKSLFDGLTKAEIWVDDSLVCDIVAKKRYGEPGISIVIAEIESS